MCNLSYVCLLVLFSGLGATDARLYFVAFLFFELSVGLYFPVMGTLKAMAVPEQQRSTVYSLFRAPLNFIVVGSLVTHISTKGRGFSKVEIINVYSIYSKLLNDP
jgi:hypothetical protein